MTEPPDNVIGFRRDDSLHENLCSAADLLRRDFPELHWNIDGILPAGTMLLFGRPKKGKSFLALMMAICVAARRPVFGKESSGRYAVYLGLEDSERRLQRRLKLCAGALGIPLAEFANSLSVSTTSKRIDNGLMEELRAFADANAGLGLIVIDMLKKITSAKVSQRSLYDQQADVGHALTKLCHEFPHLSILVVHHSRKMQSDDPFDQVSGTTGLSGSYDSLAAITDSPGSRVLHITSRDVESAEIPLMMNERGMYTLQMPDPDAVQAAMMSDTRRRVYEAVPRGQAYKRKDIATGCGLDVGIVDQQLIKLAKQGLIEKTGYGRYQKTSKRWFDEAIPDEY